MLKLGLIGGLAWPSTADYYRLLCERTNQHFTHAGATPPLPTPPIMIESLVMAETRKLRAPDGAPASAWAAFDTVFRDAFLRLQAGGCDIGAIASNTPHARLPAIQQGLDIPIVSILDASAECTRSEGSDTALVLGTEVTMRADDYANALGRLGIRTLARLPETDIVALQRVIDVEFYAGGSVSGRDSVLQLCEKYVTDPSNTAVLLACTELPLAFPEHRDDAAFFADGFKFINTTVAHVDSILKRLL